MIKIIIPATIPIIINIHFISDLKKGENLNFPSDDNLPFIISVKDLPYVGLINLGF